jgi:chloramphenicol-sensitive protein RarD
VIFRARGLFAVMLTSSILIAVNWGIFIWAIQVGRTVESSLGYYIYPLISVLLGTVLFREPLDRVQILW